MHERESTAFAEVANYARALAGDRAECELSDFGRGIQVLDVTPRNPRARPINVISEASLILTVGDIGGRWELDHTADSLELVKRICDATVAGRIVEVRALARSRVTVTLDDGETIFEVGYDGCLALLVPQPGWTRWGARTDYEPYT